MVQALKRYEQSKVSHQPLETLYYNVVNLVMPKLPNPSIWDKPKMRPGPGQAGISRPLRAPQPSLSVKTVIVTPTPTWTTLVDSSVYKTVVTQEVPTEIPLIIRGSRVSKTLYKPHFTSNLVQISTSL